MLAHIVQGVATRKRVPASLKQPPPVVEKDGFEIVYLKEWREHFKRSQDWMAEALGTDKGTISRVEKQAAGKGKNKTLGVAYKWVLGYCEALELAIPEQLRRRPSDPPTRLEKIAARPDLHEDFESIANKVPAH